MSTEMERKRERRKAAQKNSFALWCNTHLTEDKKIADLLTDLQDGTTLFALLEGLHGGSLAGLGKIKQNPRLKIQKVANLNICFKYIRDTVKIEGIGELDVHDGNETLTMGLIWSIMVFFMAMEIDCDGVDDGQQGTRSADFSKQTAAQRLRDLKYRLLAWARRCCLESGIEVGNLNSSFADGRALMAIVSSCAPEALAFDPSDDPIQTVQAVLDAVQSTYGVAPLFYAKDLVEFASDKMVVPYLVALRQTLPPNRTPLPTSGRGGGASPGSGFFPNSPQAEQRSGGGGGGGDNNNETKSGDEVRPEADGDDVTVTPLPTPPAVADAECMPPRPPAAAVVVAADGRKQRVLALGLDTEAIKAGAAAAGVTEVDPMGGSCSVPNSPAVALRASLQLPELADQSGAGGGGGGNGGGGGGASNADSAGFPDDDGDCSGDEGGSSATAAAAAALGAGALRAGLALDGIALASDTAGGGGGGGGGGDGGGGMDSGATYGETFTPISDEEGGHSATYGVDNDCIVCATPGADGVGDRAADADAAFAARERRRDLVRWVNATAAGVGGGRVGNLAGDWLSGSALAAVTAALFPGKIDYVESLAASSYYDGDDFFFSLDEDESEGNGCEAESSAGDESKVATAVAIPEDGGGGDVSADRSLLPTTAGGGRRGRSSKRVSASPGASRLATPGAPLTGRAAAGAIVARCLAVIAEESGVAAGFTEEQLVTGTAPDGSLADFLESLRAASEAAESTELLRWATDTARKGRASSTSEAAAAGGDVTSLQPDAWRDGSALAAVVAGALQGTGEHPGFDRLYAGDGGDGTAGAAAADIAAARIARCLEAAGAAFGVRYALESGDEWSSEGEDSDSDDDAYFLVSAGGRQLAQQETDRQRALREDAEASVRFVRRRAAGGDVSTGDDGELRACGIEFEAFSSRFKKASEHPLDAAARVLLATGVSVRVEATVVDVLPPGADAASAEAEAARASAALLSEERAETVAQYLRFTGVPASQIAAVVGRGAGRRATVTFPLVGGSAANAAAIAAACDSEPVAAAAAETTSGGGDEMLLDARALAGGGGDGSATSDDVAAYLRWLRDASDSARVLSERAAGAGDSAIAAADGGFAPERLGTLSPGLLALRAAPPVAKVGKRRRISATARLAAARGVQEELGTVRARPARRSHHLMRHRRKNHWRRR